MYDERPIMLLDSNALEAGKLKQVLSEASMSCPVVHCIDSYDAMEYLVEELGERPCLILMNIYASGMPGLDFLKWIKSNEALQTIPIIALADGQKEHYVNACFSLGAAGYIIRAEEYDTFKKNVDIILNYWELSRLPSSHMSYQDTC
ncbi:MAG: response regulator [Phycisphaerae bacterium]|nr:response regulator [Phycisphaerae bacterium]